MSFSLPIFGHAFHIPNWSMQIPTAVAGADGAIPAGWTLTATAGYFDYAGRRDQALQAGRRRLQSVRCGAHSGTRLAILTSPVATPPLPTVNPVSFLYYFAAWRAQSGSGSQTEYSVNWYDADGVLLTTTVIDTGLTPTAGAVDVYSGTLTPPADAYTLALQARCGSTASAYVHEWLFGGIILAFGWIQLARHPWFPGTIATPVGVSRAASTVAGRRIRTDHSRNAMRRTLAFQLGSVSSTTRNQLELLWRANRGLIVSSAAYRLASCPPLFVLPGNPGMPSIFVGDCEDERFPLAVDGWASDSQQLFAGTLNLSEIL